MAKTNHPRRVLITGTSSGFGYAGVQSLAAAGHTVLATMRAVNGKNREKAEALRSWAKQEGHTVHVIEMDVTDDASVKAGVGRALELGGGIDALINNAGVATFGLCETFSPAQFADALNTNLVGYFRVTQAVLPLMREAKAGLVTFVTSTVGRIALPFMGLYTATKFGIEGMAESLAFELKPLGIDVTLIQPGGYSTNVFQNAVQPAEAHRMEQYGPLKNAVIGYFKAFQDQAAAGQIGDPKEVGEAFVRLVETAPGQRPTRLSVDTMLGQGVAAINQACTQVQDSIYGMMGFGKK